MSAESQVKHGHLFIVSAPSGGGKTSLVNALIAQDSKVVVSVSHTTRPQRVGEEHGQHYFFISDQRFQQMQDAGEFLESATVFGALYGTSQKAVEERITLGYDVFLEIDWQGAQQVREKWPDVTSVYLVPPSKDELRSRLIGRGQDPEEVIERRMAAAMSELSHYGEYDYLIVNKCFEEALASMNTVIHAHRAGETANLPDAYPTIAKILAAQ